MKILLKKGFKVRKEEFGGIFRCPAESIIETGQSFFEVDEIGYIILRMALEGSDDKEIAKKISIDYSMDENQILFDVRDFMKQICELNIAERL